MRLSCSMYEIRRLSPEDVKEIIDKEEPKGGRQQ
jgi:hypothetical protein